MPSLPVTCFWVQGLPHFTDGETEAQRGHLDRRSPIHTVLGKIPNPSHLNLSHLEHSPTPIFPWLISVPLLGPLGGHLPTLAPWLPLVLANSNCSNRSSCPHLPHAGTKPSLQGTSGRAEPTPPKGGKTQGLLRPRGGLHAGLIPASGRLEFRGLSPTLGEKGNRPFSIPLKPDCPHACPPCSWPCGGRVLCSDGGRWG